MDQEKRAAQTNGDQSRVEGEGEVGGEESEEERGQGGQSGGTEWQARQRHLAGPKDEVAIDIASASSIWETFSTFRGKSHRRPALAPPKSSNSSCHWRLI